MLWTETDPPRKPTPLRTPRWALLPDPVAQCLPGAGEVLGHLDADAVALQEHPVPGIPRNLRLVSQDMAQRGVDVLHSNR